MRRSSLPIPTPLIFDGAMGTYYQSLDHKAGKDMDLASLEDAQTIQNIHSQYVEANADALKTNTFGLSLLLEEGRQKEAESLLQASVEHAQKAAGETDRKISVFADLGPSPYHQDDPDNLAARIYIWQLERFYALGLRCFLFETLSDDQGIAQAVEWLNSQDEECFVIVSFAIGSDGMSQSGFTGKELLEKTALLDGVDAVGFNCKVGPNHMKMILKDLDLSFFQDHGTLLYCAPNAGYPTVLGRRVVYSGSPEYFAGIMNSIRHMGVSILGGCCGTTPDHIRTMAEELNQNPQPDPSLEEEQPSVEYKTEDPLWAKFKQNKKVVAVELDPPKNDHIAPFMKNVSLLARKGADFITIADCPIGRPRADSCLLACKIKRELGILALPHMTCRDRNLNATKALLLGLAMEDIHSMLLVTGDPMPSDLRDEVKSVFSVNSRQLARYISNLYPESVCAPFHMFGALNVNAVNFEKQLELAKEKEEAGICGFLTQPVLCPQALENLKLARKTLKGKILGGILPIVSYRNALFLKNEVSGIDVSDEILNSYEGLDKAQGEEMALKLSVKIAKDIEPYVDGFYLMTPFSRVHLMVRLMNQLEEDHLL